MDLVALDDVLKELAKFGEFKSRLIELRYFGGLSVEETAEVLEVFGKKPLLISKRAKLKAKKNCSTPLISPKEMFAPSNLFSIFRAEIPRNQPPCFFRTIRLLFSSRKNFLEALSSKRSQS